MDCWSLRPSRVSQSQLVFELLGNALWLPNLVGRTPDQSILQCWDQSSCMGQPEFKLPGNPNWPSNLVTRTIDQSVTHCRGQRTGRCNYQMLVQNQGSLRENVTLNLSASTLKAGLLLIIYYVLIQEFTQKSHCVTAKHAKIWGPSMKTIKEPMLLPKVWVIWVTVEKVSTNIGV